MWGVTPSTSHCTVRTGLVYGARFSLSAEIHPAGALQKTDTLFPYT